MLFLKRVFKLLARKKPPSPSHGLNLSPALQRDIGVSITRVRLPSGAEVVVVSKHKE